MTKKDSFNKAVFDMFGVGNDHDEGVKGPAYSAPTYDNLAVEEDDILDEGLVTSHAVPVTQAAPVTPSAQPYVLVPATYIAPGTTLDGNLKSKGDVEVAGKFKGSIEAEGDVTIRSDTNANIEASNLYVYDCKLTGNTHCSGNIRLSDHSKVKGNLYAKELQCAGQVVGDVDVEEYTTLEATAVIEGNIYTESMSMERGALIKGSLTMGAKPEKPDKK